MDAVSGYRLSNPEEWAELVLLFEADLSKNPQSFIEQSALELLELEEGEAIEDAVNFAKKIMEAQ